jgi:hypothetical protein
LPIQVAYEIGGRPVSFAAAEAKEFMPSRRNFIKLISSAPLASRLDALGVRAQNKQQTAPGPSSTGPSDQMAGSPVGDQLPGQKWKVHDRSRPQARKVTPGLPLADERPSSDAIVLFDGKDLTQWGTQGRDGQVTEAKWKAENGYVEMVPRSGSLITKAAFGDCQLHLEWMTPTGTDATRRGQMRGNSGVILMKRYEVQVLSSFDNITYADGAAGGIYGLYPPLVNPCRPEGEWNSYDIVFRAPKFDGETLLKPAFLTLLFNGLVVHDHVELLGSTDTLPIAKYQPHPEEEPFLLQGHAGPVRYRNIWIRRLQAYDS